MKRAVCQWVDSLPVKPEDHALTQLQRLLTRSYVVYGDMLLLPASILESSGWRDALNRNGESALANLLANICQCMKVSHIAISQPIPLYTDRHADTLSATNNTLRSPLHFTPVYGDFGPAEVSLPATSLDFDQAYWVTAKQNGINQTWAPRWTMFSRGNISEKARLLSLESVSRVVEEGANTAVDLYAGIGYFAFSYVKAGVTKVLCWELNDWSCEGLRRGADANRWPCMTVDLERCEGFDGIDLGTNRIALFHESNENASRRLRQIPKLPPIRHVNCGLLPSSRSSWLTAFAAISAEYGGWIHVHENFALVDIEEAAQQVQHSFQKMLSDASMGLEDAVVLESITKVKSYAPGVWHCVLDIFVPAYVRAGVASAG